MTQSQAGAQVDLPVEVLLPDGSKKSMDPGSTAADLAKSISEGLFRKSVGALINKEIRDLYTELQQGDVVQILTEKDKESIELLRHSTAHVMAEAVQSLFPQARIAIGPTIEDGFYYDFEIADHNISSEDLLKIEERMTEIVKQNQQIVRHCIENVDEQIAIFKSQGEKFKAELLEEHREHNPTLYLMKDKDGTVVWNDLCRGPHLPNTSFIKAFKLMKVSGSYWRADEKREHLQRVYATAWWSKKDLDAYLQKLEEAEKRDHRKLAKQLDLFSVHEEVGPGLIFWHPNLATVRDVIEDFWRKEHRRRGYQFVYTPHIASEELYRVSGHLENYGENMYAPMDIDGDPYRCKPMNCPGHIMIYKNRLRSYRDLPLRFAELGTVYRYERSGVLHGMLRVRGFTQDDSHIFCTPEQLEGEIDGVLDLIDKLMTTFGYTYKCYLSTRPEKSLGTDEEWAMATGGLENALIKRGIDYEVDAGGGVFYAPKIDVKLFDAIGREWQGPTIQVDLNLPKRFDVSYIGEDGSRHQAVMVHRAVLGSMERFCGGLIEHYAGSFPFWLAPTQVAVLPIADRHHDFCDKLMTRLLDNDFRAQLDARAETVNYRIREAQMQQTPYMVVIGDKEQEEGKVALRHRRDGQIGLLSVDELIERFKKERAEFA
ncbi:threonine--tRNA ligase [bacterium]|nr:threonine--tRNA ligase [bacterium]QQR57149.1 MAG: threonine--tRNA ligase [Candidatus Melainabacteria bacterium]